MKLIDFFKQFPDEESCRDYFREQRQKEGITCRNCNGTTHYWMKTIEQFQCKACRTRTTLRSGTVMAQTEKVKDPKNHRQNSRYKYFKMRVMPDLKSKTINKVVKDSMNPKTKVKTDSFSSYSRLNEVIKKQVSKVTPPDQAGKELPWIHIAISNAKRNLLNDFHHVDDTYLQNYLDEFTYRLNRRYFGDKLFGRLLIACISFCWII